MFLGRPDAQAPRVRYRRAAGHITKQGSKLVRWAAVEAIQRQPAGTKISADRKRIEARRGRNIAKVAAARKLLTLVDNGLRDGQIRALAHHKAAA